MDTVDDAEAMEVGNAVKRLLQSREQPSKCFRGYWHNNVIYKPHVDSAVAGVNK